MALHDLYQHHEIDPSLPKGGLLSRQDKDFSNISAKPFPFTVVDSQISFSESDLQNFHDSFPPKDYPSLWSLIEEVSVPAFRLPEAWSKCDLVLKHDMVQMAFTLAAVLDTREQKLASSRRLASSFLPANASQEANLAYLDQYAKDQLATAQPLPDFPLKVQMFYQLAKMGLADPDTRCYPSWDITCIAAKIVQLIKQGRNPWISTARRTDFAYTGILYNPNAAPRYHPKIPKSVLAFFDKVIGLKQECPLWFPKEVENTPPLFKNIKTLSGFFFEVMPQLLVLAHDHHRSFCKVFPQDKPVTSANLVLDLHGDPSLGDLGPSLTFEMSAGYTHRGINGKQIPVEQRATYYPHHNLLSADQQSALALAKIFFSPLPNGQLLAPQLITLLEKLHTPGLALEVMVNLNGSVAFVVDTYPVKKGLIANIPPQVFFNLLPTSSVVNPLKRPSLIQQISANERNMQILTAQEAGIDLVHGLKETDDGKSIPVMPYSKRPTWKEVAMADKKSHISTVLSTEQKLADLV